MMKIKGARKLIYYACSIIMATYMFACEEKKETKDNEIVGVESLSLVNTKLRSVISEYIRLNETDKETKVYRLVIEQGNGDIVFKLSYIRNLSELLRHPPTAYFLIDGRTVLVNSGLEKVTQPTVSFMKDLQESVRPYLKNDVMSDSIGSGIMPVVYYADVWDIEIHTDDSLTVSRKGRSPYVKYLSGDEQIKFKPPTEP